MENQENKAMQLPENAFRQGKTKPSQNVGRIQRRAWKMGHSLGNEDREEAHVLCELAKVQKGGVSL